jgi:hypothetical protein
MTSHIAALRAEIDEWAQELEDSLHGVIRKDGKVISHMGGIPADFGWQTKTANQAKLLRETAMKLEAVEKAAEAEKARVKQWAKELKGWREESSGYISPELPIFSLDLIIKEMAELSTSQEGS